MCFCSLSSQGCRGSQVEQQDEETDVCVCLDSGLYTFSISTMWGMLVHSELSVTLEHSCCRQEKKERSTEDLQSRPLRPMTHHTTFMLDYPSDIWPSLKLYSRQNVVFSRFFFLSKQVSMADMIYWMIVNIWAQFQCGCTICITE